MMGTMNMPTAHRRVSAGAAVGLTSFAFATTMLGTTLPTPLYPHYELEFGFGALTVTLVFAAYAVGVLAALIGAGRASDTIGRRPVLLAALGFAALSAVVFLIAGGMSSGGLPWLFVGRVLSGFSAGLFTGTGTATIADFAGPKNRLRASVIGAVANIGGLGLGPLISGALAKWVAHPLQTPFVLHLVLVVLAAIAIWAVPEPVKVDRTQRLTFQRLEVPAPARAAFIQAGTAGFAGFALLGLFTAVSPSVLGLLGHHNPALTGLVVFTVFAASAAGQVLSSRLPTRQALLSGTAILIVGFGFLAASLAASSLALLVIAAVVGGAGQGLSFRAALGLVTEASPPAQRGGVSSSFFAVVYVGISLPVVGVGAGTQQWGLVHTGEVFAGILAVLGIFALISLARHRAAEV